MVRFFRRNGRTQYGTGFTRQRPAGILGWLAADLAERGAIVAVVNHPNSTWGDFDFAKGMDHGSRTADLSLVLNTLMDDPEVVPMLDASRVMAAGFSFGGWTALSTGGLTGNIEGYRQFCAGDHASSSQCQDIAQAEFDLASIDDVQWNAPTRMTGSAMSLRSTPLLSGS